MKRSTFIKNIAALAGGGVILSCKNDLIDSFLEPVTTNTISIEDAKEWFEKSYLEKFNNFRYTSKSAHEREADWDRALYTEVKNRGKCVVVPIKYLNKYRPAFAAWHSKNDFVEKLLEYYTHPILEVLVVYNDDNDRPHAYLSQIAYDRYHLIKNRLDIDQYYGWFLKSDWNDNVLEAAYYEKGRQKLISKNGSTQARLALNCGYFYTGAAHFSYSYTDQDGGVVIVWQKEYAYYCFEPGHSGYAYAEYPNEIDEGTFPGGGGGGTYTVPVTTSFNVKNAICNPGGADRSQMNQSLQDALFATGLANDITGFSWSKADALLRSLGANIDEFLPTLSVAGRTVGVVGGTFAGAGVLMSGTKLYLGITDGTGFTWDDDGWDVVQFGLAAAGGGVLLAGGVVAAIASLVIGGVSIGISIHTQKQEIQSKQHLRQLNCN